MTCEKNYKKGILIFEEIIKEKSIIAEESKIKTYEEQREKVLYTMTPVMKEEIKKTEPRFSQQNPSPTYEQNLSQTPEQNFTLQQSPITTPSVQNSVQNVTFSKTSPISKFPNNTPQI